MLKGLLLGITGDYFHLGLCAAPQSIHCLKRAVLPPLTGVPFKQEALTADVPTATALYLK